MWLESTVDQGSTFHFMLPYSTWQVSETKGVTKVAESFCDLSVLVVDDNETNLHILETMLTRWQMKPTLVQHGTAALKAMVHATNEGNPFGLVLLDLQMPDMDGFTVAQTMRQVEVDFNVPIVLLTSGSQTDLSKKCRETGINAYLMKPFLQPQLKDVIMTVLGLRRDAGEDVPERAITTYSKSTGAIRILLAEDNKVNQHLAERLLIGAGHEVVIANNGAEAVAVFEDQPIDLILMDVQMPVMSGLEATRIIRKKEVLTGRHVPIIAATARAQNEDKEHCLDAGMDAYVSKPFKKEQLLQLIEAIFPTGIARISRDMSDSDDKEKNIVDLTRVADESIINWSDLRSVYKGGEDVLEQVVRIFLDECPDYMENIQTAYAKRDCAQLGASAHCLRGALANIYATSALNHAAALEASADAQDLESAERSIKKLNREIDRLRVVLTKISKVDRAA